MESILCAAIWIDTGKPAHPPMSFAYPETGLLFAGWRHPDCFMTMLAWAELLTEEQKAEIPDFDRQVAGRHQGFLTSLSRFVDREEAQAIALRAGQVQEGETYQKVPGDLFSEDLY